LAPRIRRALGRRFCLNELPAQWKQHSAVAGAEKAKVPDADESSWQHMQQEAPKKFVHRQTHSALLVLVGRVTPSERYLALLQ
jgi:hypothetical protein